MSCSSGGVGHGSSGAAIDFQSCATSGRSPHPIVTAASVSASPTITSAARVRREPQRPRARPGAARPGPARPAAGRSAASAASSPSSCDSPAGATFTARTSIVGRGRRGRARLVLARAPPRAGAAGRAARRSRKVSRIADRSGSAAWNSSRSISTGTSGWIVASSFDMRASSAWFVRFSLRFAPEISSIEPRTRLEVAEALQQVRRGLVADAGDARDVVRGVALQPVEVGDQLRRDPVAVDHGLAVVDLRLGDPAARRHHPHALADDLEHVAVAGHDHDVDPLLARLARQRRDHVVGLVALDPARCV